MFMGVCVCFKKGENAYEHARVCYFSVQSQRATKAFLQAPLVLFQPAGRGYEIMVQKNKTTFSVEILDLLEDPHNYRRVMRARHFYFYLYF